MQENLDRIAAIIDRINLDIDTQDLFNDENDFEAVLTFRTNGLTQIIEFLGNSIWSSENDAREFFEKENKYDDLEQFVVKEINKLLCCLRKLKMPERDQLFS